MHYVSLQDNLSPKNYSHNLMLGLDMLHREVSCMMLMLLSSCEYKGSIFICLFSLFSTSTFVDTKAAGQCCGDLADRPSKKSQEGHFGMLTHAEVCFLLREAFFCLLS